MVLAILIVLVGIVLPIPARASWVNIVYDPEVPTQTQENVQRAVDTTAGLLEKYNIALGREITVVVTADEASYAKALMFYMQMLQDEAEKRAKYTGGESMNNKPIIVVKETPRLQNSAVEVFRVLPHELFHQVQNQYGHTRTVNWLVEGTPEVFQFVARETAGFEKVADNIRMAEQIIRQAPAIHDVRQLASYDYKA